MLPIRLAIKDVIDYIDRACYREKAKNATTASVNVFSFHRPENINPISTNPFFVYCHGRNNLSSSIILANQTAHRKCQLASRGRAGNGARIRGFSVLKVGDNLCELARRASAQTA